MTTRLSSYHLASEGSFDTVSTDSLSEMRALVAEYGADPCGAVLDNWEPREGTIITEVRAISARINQNFDAWPSEELRTAHQTFVGKPVFVNHNNHDPDRARGRVVASRYVDAGENDRYVQVLQEVEASRFPMLAKELLEGGLDSVSMGAEAREVECSYCSNISTSPFDACEHIAMKGATLQRRTASGQTEDVLIYEICRKISFFELSYVFDPADETAVASNVLVASRQVTADQWDDAVAGAIADGGFTFRTAPGDGPRGGYMVAIQGGKKTVPSSGTTPDVVREYMDEHSDLLRDPNNYVGGWDDGGTFYLDVSITVKDRDEAIQLGKETGQIAIWDVVGNDEIRTSSRRAVNEVELPPKVDTLHPDEDEKSSDDWHEYVDNPNVIDTIDVLDEPDLGLNQQLERPEDEVPEGFEEFENIDEEIEQNEQAEEEMAQESRNNAQDKVDEEAEAEAEEQAEQARQNLGVDPAELDENGNPIEPELDENGEPVVDVELDENGEPVVEVELDENGEPIEPELNPNEPPDESADPDVELDEFGNPIFLDENGDPVPLDEDGNPIVKNPEKDEDWDEEEDGAGGKTKRFKGGKVEAMVADDYGTFNMWVEKNGRLLASDSYTTFQEAKAAAVEVAKQNIEKEPKMARKTTAQRKKSGFDDQYLQAYDYPNGTEYEYWNPNDDNQPNGRIVWEDDDELVAAVFPNGNSSNPEIQSFNDEDQALAWFKGRIESLSSDSAASYLSRRKQASTYAPGDRVEHTDDGVKGTVVVSDPYSGEVTVDWEDGESSTEPEARLRSASRRKAADWDDSDEEDGYVTITPESAAIDFKEWLGGRAPDFDLYDDFMDQYPYADQVGEEEDRALVRVIDRLGSHKNSSRHNGVKRRPRTNDQDTPRKESHMAPQRRRRIADDNKQTPLLEETGIAQTPAPEPVALPDEGDSVANNSESDRVKSARKALARELAIERGRQRRAKARKQAEAVGEQPPEDDADREDLFEDFPATTMTAKLRKRFAAWVEANYGVTIRQASGPGELRSWARTFSKEAGIELPRLHAAIKRDVQALKTAGDDDDEGVSSDKKADDDDIPDFIQEKIDGDDDDDDDDDDDKKESRRKAALRRRRSVQAQSPRGRRTQTSRRKTADEKLDLAAPGDRVDVEKPTSGTTDEDAEASQFDKADFDNNSGKGLENPDTTPAAGTPGGPSVNDLKSRNSARASGLQAVQLAEAMITVGLCEDSSEAKFKAAAEFEKMSRDIILDRTALLGKVAKVQTARRSSSTKSAGNRGTSLNSAVPPNLSGATRPAAPRREAAADTDSDLFL